jgi:hypothetical protein
MPLIQIDEPATNWEAPNSGDGPGESWRSLIVKVNAMNVELFARIAALEAIAPKPTAGSPNV